MIEVTVFNKSGADQSFRFEKSTISIGRASDNDIQLDTDGVSRYHAQVQCADGGLFIEDTKSTNGILLNTKKVTRSKVAAQDRIVIGEMILALRAETRAQEDKPKEDRQEACAEIEAAAALSAHLDNDFYWNSLKNFLAPIWQYIVDDSVSEIMINGPDEIYIERSGRLHRTQNCFSTTELRAAVLNIAQYVGRRVDEQVPYLDARLPDGSRVSILLPPCSRKGISIAIRKFAKEALTLEKLIDFGSLSPAMLCYLKAAVALKKNIVVSGGTSSGKTSLLNVVSGLIPDDQRIITIEDSAELQLRQEHVLPMETKPPDKKGRGQITIRDLVKTSLRMRPDRIVVGEVRGGEALDLLQAMNTGHSGSMATVHASSPPQALTRLETLALFSGLDIPIRALREQVSSAVDIVLQTSRLPDSSRKVTHISEVGALTEHGEYRVKDIFRFERSEIVDGAIHGSHLWTKQPSQFVDEMNLAGLADALLLFEEQHKG